MTHTITYDMKMNIWKVLFRVQCLNNEYIVIKWWISFFRKYGFHAIWWRLLMYIIYISIYDWNWAALSLWNRLKRRTFWLVDEIEKLFIPQNCSKLFFDPLKNLRTQLNSYLLSNRNKYYKNLVCKTFFPNKFIMNEMLWHF